MLHRDRRSSKSQPLNSIRVSVMFALLMQTCKPRSRIVYYQACLRRNDIKANSFLLYKHTCSLKHWKIWQKHSLAVKLPDVSAVGAAAAPRKHFITLRNDASSLWAGVLSPLSPCVLCTLRSYSSCPLLLIFAAAHMLSHSSLTQFTGIVLSVGSHARWRCTGNSREWIPSTKLSVPRICFIVFYKSLLRKLSMLMRYRIMGYGKKSACWPKIIIMYGKKNFHPCGQKTNTLLSPFLLKEITWLSESS